MTVATERPELPPTALEDRWAVPVPDGIACAANDATASVGAALCHAAEYLRAFAASSVGGPWPAAWAPAWRGAGAPPWLAPPSSPWEAAQAASWAGLLLLALAASLRLLVGPGSAARPQEARGSSPPAARAKRGPRQREEEGGVSAPQRTEPAP